MIDRLIIERFKSIKYLDIPCKKVNIFIGEPNSGKSNILEALGVFSQENFENWTFNPTARYKTVDDFFYDSNINKEISIRTTEIGFELFFDRDKNGNSTNLFLAKYHEIDKIANPSLANGKESLVLSLQPDGRGQTPMASGFSTSFRSYCYSRLKSFGNAYKGYLATPDGDNIPSLLKSNAELRSRVSTILKDLGFRLLLRPIENEIFISKEVNDEIYSYPYYSISETIQRLIFMTLAIESNKGAIMTFDEPESNTFPLYTKQIAESIAFDESNQFFLTTHDPYLLLSLVEKTPVSDLNVFVTKMKNYETVVYPLDESQFSRLLDLGSDSFFNLSTILAGE